MNLALLLVVGRPSCWFGPDVGRGCGRRKDHEPNIGRRCDRYKDHGLGPSVGHGCDRRKDHRGIEDTELLDIRDVVRESWVKIKLLVVI